MNSILQSLLSLTEGADTHNKHIEVSQEQGGGMIESLIQILHENGPHSGDAKVCLINCVI